MIDPIHSLAFSIQANRGVYALLLGSGVSRAAQIPTGWEVTRDLVCKLSALTGEPCDMDTAEQWYVRKFQAEPQYSDLLDKLCKTQAERQALLRPYWEPNGQEREEGVKQPTAAHRAIASLVAQGFIRVIVTTNFDRLLEGALAEAGVVPTVLSSEDQVRGALPLIHAQICVFKVHGDYLDHRIRNTPSELAEFPPAYNQLLDRIFDEFGLIVCGWSAEWDQALCAALERAPSRRFTTFWAQHGELGDCAKRLTEHRRAQVIPINDADSFFTKVQELVGALEEYARPHPLSTEAAVVSLKRYLTEPRHRIQLSDLVNEILDRTVESIDRLDFGTQKPEPTNETMEPRVRKYEAACETLIAVALTGGLWADDSHIQLWQRALERLSRRKSEGGYVAWVELQRYPATLLMFALGIGAVESGKLSFMGHLFSSVVQRENRESTTAVEVLPASYVIPQDAGRLLPGMANRKVPGSDWLHAAFRSVAKRAIPDDDRYSYVFDKLEILIALCYVYKTGRSEGDYWFPCGAYCYRTKFSERVFAEIEESLSSTGSRSPFVISNLFGKTAEECTTRLSLFKTYVHKVVRQWF